MPESGELAGLGHRQGVSMRPYHVLPGGRLGSRGRADRTVGLIVREAERGILPSLSSRPLRGRRSGGGGCDARRAPVRPTCLNVSTGSLGCVSPLTSRSVYRIASAEPIPRMQGERGIPILDSAGSQGKRLLQDDGHNARDSSDNAYHRVPKNRRSPVHCPTLTRLTIAPSIHLACAALRARLNVQIADGPGLVHQYAP